MRLSLIIIAITLLIFIGGYLFWGMGVIIAGANGALNVNEQGRSGMSGFNLDAAKKLDLRGLVQ